MSNVGLITYVLIFILKLIVTNFFVIFFLVVTASEKCSECKENFLARKLTGHLFIFQDPVSSFSSKWPRESSVLEAEEGGGGVGWSEGISPLVQMDPL